MQIYSPEFALLCSTFITDIAPLCSTYRTKSAPLCGTFNTDNVPMWCSYRTDSAPLCGTFWGHILGRNPDKSLKFFPPCYTPSLLQLFALSFLFFNKLTQPLTVSSVQLLYTVKEKGGKPDRKPYPLFYGLRNPYRNLKSEISQDYAQKSQRNCTFMNSASVEILLQCAVPTEQINAQMLLQILRLQFIPSSGDT